MGGSKGVRVIMVSMEVMVATLVTAAMLATVAMIATVHDTWLVLLLHILTK